MRATRLLTPGLALVLGCAAPPLVAQTVERADTPKSGVLRLTFDPRIVTWDEAFTPTGLASLGAPLTGDTVGAAHIPLVAQMQQDVRAASGLPNWIANLGAGLLSVYQEKRITPIGAELGITDRLSLAVTLPIVRVATRSAFQLSQTNANLGANPLVTSSAALQQYASFFGHFATALTQLKDSVANGSYGCPGSPMCTQAQALLAQGLSLETTLERLIYGGGSVANPFLPIAASLAGQQIDTTVAHLEQQLQGTYHVPGFTDTLLLAADTLAAPVGFDTFLQGAVGANGAVFGFGYNPLRNTYRYGLGDVTVEAKYRVVRNSVYALALGVVAQLPTGTRDSTLELIGAPIADHVFGLEGRVLQELTLARRIWLNIAVRAGMERPGTQARRVAPFDAFLVPYEATTELAWTPGNYIALDCAPLYRLTPEFAAGFTVGYYSKAADHYSYQTAADSTTLATTLGVPIPAAVLDQGTSERWVRLGAAITYVGPVLEGGFTVERTVSGAGAQVPAATVFRLVLRLSRKLS